MRALDCQCGRHLEGRDDEELYGLARDHVERDHPEMELSDEQVRGIVEQGAYDKGKKGIMMGEQTNVDVVQRNYEAVGRGDIPALLELLSDDVEWTLQGPSVIPWAGIHRGREGVAEFFSLLGENLEFEQFEPREFVAQGDTVVVLGYERSLVKPTGRTFEQEWAHVFTLRNGKIAKARFIEDTAAQVVAFGAA